jgi:L-ascorbate metabolism protein UlaG (beta-lactamase superfamily)
MRSDLICACLFAIATIGCAPHVTRPAAPVATARAARAPITLTYLGAAGYQLQSGAITLLADPYFSRPAAQGVALPDPQAIAAHAPEQAQLIMVGHSHVDHLLDVPSLALVTNAQVMGSLSTARVARAAGVPQERIITIKGGEDYALGDYSVRVLPSLHSALEHKHRFGTEIAEPVTLPMKAADYAEGGTFGYLVRMGGHEVLFLGTANFIESELEGLRPDIAIVATGLRQEIHDYTCRLLRVLGAPPLVLPNHFDDWSAPPRDAPADADLLAFVEEVRACSPHTRVIVPRHFVPLVVP